MNQKELKQIPKICAEKIKNSEKGVNNFDTHDKSFHGLPDPLNFPDTKNRKSIILYYYTVESRPSEHVDTDKPHSALWKKRGGLDKRGNKTRDFS